MRALVTGGTGFVGGAVVRELLRRGAGVRVLARAASRTEGLEGLGVEIARGDILDGASVRAALAGCDAVIHAAAIYEYAIRDVEGLMRTEVEGTRTVLEAAREAGIERVVYTSTALVVGEPRGVLGTEETPHRGYFLSAYERAKFEAERVAKRYAPVILRPAGVVGAGDLKPSGRSVLNVVNGRLPMIFRGWLSLVDVDDVAWAHAEAAERGEAGRAYILGGGVYSLEEWMGTACRLAGTRVPPVGPGWMVGLFARGAEAAARVTGGRPLVSYESYALAAHGFRVDGGRAARELGVKYTPLETSLRRALGWYWEQGLLRRRPACC